MNKSTYDPSDTKQTEKYTFYGWNVSKSEWLSADQIDEPLPKAENPSDDLYDLIKRFNPLQDGAVTKFKFDSGAIPVYVEEVNTTLEYRGRKECTKIELGDSFQDSQICTSSSNMFKGEEVPSSGQEDLSEFLFYKIGESEPIGRAYQGQDRVKLLSPQTTIPLNLVPPLSDKEIAQLLGREEEFIVGNI